MDKKITDCTGKFSSQTSALEELKIVLEDPNCTREVFAGYEVQAVAFNTDPDGSTNVEGVIHLDDANAFGLYARFQHECYWLGDYETRIDALKAALYCEENI